MLCAVVMHLQTQRATGLHRDAHDLEVVAHVDRVIAAPRPVGFAIPGRLGPVGSLEFGDKPFDVLDLILVRHQHHVGGIHHHSALCVPLPRLMGGTLLFQS